ncbi:antimicrobial peptide NK-lysin-like [Anas acuta]|uniref:antimicrobial peptide NK-lysin-like n=1 Tax=Anas acuta TaxID=28680 RepID=UPI0035C94265
MASLLLALLPAVTALVLVGAESPPLSHQTLPAGDTEDGPWLQLGDKDSTGGGGQLSNSLRCKICHSIVKALGKLARKIKDKDRVTRATERICGRLGPLKSRCERLMQRWVAPIVDALAHNEAPDRICTRLRLCRKKV